MYNRIGSTIVKHVKRVAMHVLHNCFGFVINTTAYHLDRYKPSNPSTKDLIDLIASSNREIVKDYFLT